MDGWMDIKNGWIDIKKQIDGWMDKQIDGWMDKQIDGWMDRTTDGWLNGKEKIRWLNGQKRQMNGWMYSKNGLLDGQ